MSLKKYALIAAAVVALSTGVSAQQGQGRGQEGRGQPGQGPVALHCGEDLAKLCPGVEHGNRAGRTCLETNIKSVSADCRNALNTTGGGRRGNH